MAKKEKDSDYINIDALDNMAGTDDPEVARKYLINLFSSMFLPDSSPEKIIQELNPCLSIIQSIQPRDQLETLLIMQMMAAYNTTMECSRRANIPDQTFEGRTTALNQAAKFMHLYIDQLNALNKHRGKGQQSFIVGQVNVESGGQAIVGNVKTDKPDQATPAPTLEHNPIESIDLSVLQQKKKAPLKRSQK